MLDSMLLPSGAIWQMGFDAAEEKLRFKMQE